jgi:glycosyltransferase involved in cell wall biosynthesis
MIELWLIGVLFLSGLLHLGFSRWGRDWRLEPADGASPCDAAILIPARDEAGKIGACVRAALRAPVRRVVVVDDGSTDATADEALNAAGGDPRFELQSAAPRPAGWSGKAWACSEAAGGAEEAWLLFVDADVVLHPDAPVAAVRRAERDEAGLLSLFGTWELVSFWERVGIPAIGWFIRGTLDLDDVNGARGNPRRAFANGQFILVQRSVYASMGGHGAVRDAVLDDVGLAEAMRKAGVRGRMLWAPWAFRVRLYENLRAIVQGYRKNLYAGMGRRPALAALAVTFVFATGVAPVVALAESAIAGDTTRALLAGACVASSAALRFRTERRDGRSGMVAMWEPLAASLLCAVLATSAVAPASTWKGRSFQAGRAAD